MSDLEGGARTIDEAFLRASLPERVRIVRDVARALEHLHGRGIAHRDVRPSNVLVRADGLVRLADGGAGWAGAWRPGAPVYAAPETALPAGALSPAGDVWSLGVLLFEAVAGVHPFAGLSLEEVAARARRGAPRLEAALRGLPASLDATCGRALAYDPLSRHAEAGSFARELDQALAAPSLRETPGGLVRPRAANLVAGMRLGPYTLLSLLGQGGMGQVFRARDEGLGRDVALKVMREDRRSPDQEARFAREMEAACRVEHPNIVRVHAAGEDLGLRYLVTDLVAGQGLDVVLARSGTFPPLRAAEIGRKLARAIEALHAVGVLHRDVKPANVLVDEQGEPRLTDFGVAKLEDAAALTQTHQIVGTPAYAPPEQLEGKAVDGRVDVYALGATLYELVAGHAPFDAPDLVRLVAAKKGRPRPPSQRGAPGGPSFDAACLRCLESRAEDRFATAGEAANAFEAALSGTAPSGLPRTILAALVLVALGLAVGLFLIGRGGREASSEDPALALERTVDARRASAGSLRALDLADVASAVAALGPGADGSRTVASVRAWIGLAALGHRDLETAARLAAVLAQDPSREAAALRGGLGALLCEDGPRALRELERARAGGLALREVEAWRLRVLLRRGPDRAAAARAAQGELARLKEAGGLGVEGSEVEVAILAALGRREAAEKALARLEWPPPELAWSVALLAVDEALERGDAAGACRALGSLARPAGPADASEQFRAERVAALLEKPAANIAVAVPITLAEGECLTFHLELLRRVAPPGYLLPAATRGAFARGIETNAVCMSVLAATAAAELSPDDDDLVYEAAYSASEAGAQARAAAARIEALARRAASVATSSHRLAARVEIARALLNQDRFEDAMNEAASAGGAIERALAGHAIESLIAAQLLGELTILTASAQRGAGHPDRALATLERGAASEILNPFELASERALAFAALGKPEEALAAGLGGLGDASIGAVGSKLGLANVLWEIALKLGRAAALSRATAAVEAWHLGESALWWSRRAIVAAEAGDAAQAAALVRSARSDDPGKLIASRLEDGLARGDRAALIELRRLERQLASLSAK